MSDLKTLQFKKVDLEPDRAEPILVPLGNSDYQAHCPNDYEFIALMGEVRKLQEDPSSIDIIPLVSAFFTPHDVKVIDRRCRTGEISFIGELAPALNALADHYRESVEKRLQEVQAKIASPKAR